MSDSTILGRPIYGEPESICSQSYVPIGINNELKSELECVNVIKYISSKFFRCLVAFNKNTQSASKAVYTFVPLQDFTSESDIDWSKDVAEIDRQLYAKYGLDEEEIAFIERMIKPM